MRLDIIKQAEEIAAMDYQARVDREDDHEGPPIYVAHIAEIPECVAQGASPELAQAELREIFVEVINICSTPALMCHGLARERATSQQLKPVNATCVLSSTRV